MDLPAHTRERIAELRALHQPPGIKLTRTGRFRWWANLFPDHRCVLCLQQMPCSQIRWCDEVEAGRRPPAGRIQP